FDHAAGHSQSPAVTTIPRPTGGTVSEVGGMRPRPGREDCPMSVSSDSLRRWEPYAGVAYVVFFLASMAVSNPPADNASNQKWIRSYASRGEQIHHLATGLL